MEDRTLLGFSFRGTIDKGDHPQTKLSPAERFLRGSGGEFTFKGKKEKCFSRDVQLNFRSMTELMESLDLSEYTYINIDTEYDYNCRPCGHELTKNVFDDMPCEELILEPAQG